MRCSRRNLRSPRILLVTVCAAAVVILAACGSSGEPTSYDGTVETNFTAGCEKAAEADAEIRPAARQYCACAWSRLIDRDGISFEDFKKLDDDVKDDPEKIRGSADDEDDEDSTAATLNAIFNDCRATHARG